MLTVIERHLPVSGTYNVRDLGGYDTPAGQTRLRRILRADGLHRLDADGMAALITAGVATVIDLRHAGELETGPNPFATHPDVTYHNVSLFDLLAPVPNHPGDALLDLYLQALAERQAEIRSVLTLIAEADQGVVLFHCTAGKDRTGIIAALILGLVGVTASDIVEDYARTGQMIGPLVEHILAEAEARGTDMAAFMPLLACEPATMVATLAAIEQDHGSVEAYLAKIGLPEAVTDRIKSRLLGEI